MKATFLIGICVLSMTATAALAQTAQVPKPAAKKSEQSKAAPAKPAVVPAAVGGVMIFVDPVTHEIRQPDAAEMTALTGAPSQNRAQSDGTTGEVIYGPGNAVGLKLDESTMTYMVMTKTPDGKLKMDCVTGPPAMLAKPAAVQSVSTAKKGAVDDK